MFTRAGRKFFFWILISNSDRSWHSYEKIICAKFQVLKIISSASDFGLKFRKIGQKSRKRLIFEIERTGQNIIIRMSNSDNYIVQYPNKTELETFFDKTYIFCLRPEPEFFWKLGEISWFWETSAAAIFARILFRKSKCIFHIIFSQKGIK